MECGMAGRVADAQKWVLQLSEFIQPDETISLFKPSATGLDFFKELLATHKKHKQHVHPSKKDALARTIVDEAVSSYKKKHGRDFSLIEELSSMPIDDDSLEYFCRESGWYFEGVIDRRGWLDHLISALD
jgi:hypothetical protein